MNGVSKLSRRSYLAGVGSAATVGIAGCLGRSSGIDELALAYMPIFPDLQYLVMESEGYLDEIDADIDDLEGNELVNREIVSEKPVRVEYSLTGFGRSLEPVVYAMRDWAWST